ncbi:killer cell lectin-like receptor subfamily B member 1B allele A [Hippopotamus amphibius kiboko]|uniref:killer cell lectin-like receptor subfamily B member 1B allele A n=1 Tax=Hippopotamus amphibius kiboko TaxID=575201 RepID=UPI00259573EA|nr:killer cell lectin-like receptor subfamily B member 1B allele A [Hippopotamus amphibius kiboko]
MSGDIVYADLKHSSSERSSSCQRSDSNHHGIFLKVACAMIIILLAIVIVLSILVIQFKSARHTQVNNESKEKYCSGQNKSETSTSIVSFNSSTARKSCPSEDWELHGGKCYLVAKDKKSWDESKDDCVMKNSHLMVIQDFTDVIFLWQNLHASEFYWIGLRLPAGGEPWTWMDNSTFDSWLFSKKEKKPQTRSRKCGQVSHTEIANENCEKRQYWICQM